MRQRQSPRDHWRTAAGTALRLALIAVGLLLLTTASASAQADGITVQLSAVSVDDWPRAQLVVTVADSDGRSLAGLEESNFQASFNDLGAPVVEVAQGVDSSLPIAVVLALDASGSMEEGGALEQAKSAAREFLAGLAAQDTVAVVAFHDTVDLVQPFTQDHAAAAAAIDELTAAGATALYEATAESVRLAAEAGAGRRAVVLLSDGLDHGSALPRADAILAAQQLGVPVFTIGLGGETDRAYLEELADVSGGRLAETASPTGLAQLYQEVGELLRGQYILTLDASELGLDVSEPAALSLQVTSGAGVAGDERSICPQRLCLTLTDLAAGERLIELRTVRAEVVSEDPVTSVTFSVDGVSVLELTEPPYELSLDPAAYPDGEHIIAAEAVTGADRRGREVTVQVGAAGGGIPMGLLAGGAVAIVALAAAVLLFFQRRGRGDATDGPKPEPSPEAPLKPAKGPQKADGRLWEDGPPGPPPAPPEEALGHLRITSGPSLGETFAVGGAPISIGTGHRCLIRLAEDDDSEGEIASEHARVWIRDGQLMVHEMRRLNDSGGSGGAWEILTPGDTFSIGQYTFLFSLPEEDGEVAQEAAGVADILRDRKADGEAPEGSAPAPDVPRPASGGEREEPPAFGSQPTSAG